MKTTQTLFVLFALLLLVGCGKIGFKQDLRIDIGAIFNNDEVTVQLDDETVFTGTVTTDEILGFAKILTLKAKKGKRKLVVTVNGVEKTERFNQQKGTVIYIGKKGASEILITFPEKPYDYD